MQCCYLLCMERRQNKQLSALYMCITEKSTYVVALNEPLSFEYLKQGYYQSMVLHEHKVIGSQSLSQADLLKIYHSCLHWKIDLSCKTLTWLKLHMIGNLTLFSTVLQVFVRLNVNIFGCLTKESYKNACQKHDGADHWYFGSITQIARAAVNFALGDRDCGIRRLAQLRFSILACRWFAAAFSVDRNGYVALFPCHKGFSTSVCANSTGNLFFGLITVIPVLES